MDMENKSKKTVFCSFCSRLVKPKDRYTIEKRPYCPDCVEFKLTDRYSLVHAQVA